MNDQEAVHFGPVYGRPSGSSMALCIDPTSRPAGSRTMTRRATITCHNCLKLMTEDQRKEATGQEGGK